MVIFPLMTRKALGPTIENSLIGIDAPILSCTGNGKFSETQQQLIQMQISRNLILE